MSKKAKKAKKESPTKGLGCLVLFALPFAGVGVFMAYLIGAAFMDWSSMRSREEVPAEIVSVNRWVSRDSDSNSTEAQATYRYQYLGRSFTGTRVSLHKGSDSIGGFQEDTYRELLSHRGSTFRCFVNPANPAEAVLYRDLRWELIGFYSIFLVVFGGAGFGLMAMGLLGGKKAKREAELKEGHPDEPWKHKEAWATGKIVSTTKPVLVMSAIFAVFWNAISSPLWFMIPEIVENENKLALLAFMFPVVGGGLIFWALRNFVRYKKFGESVFEMGTLPGVIGGPLAGTIRTTVNVRPEDGFELTLSSVRVRQTGSGKNRSTHETVLWQKSHVIARELLAYDLRRSAIPVSFAIPFDGKASDESNADDRIVWKLEVAAAVPGVDYHATFEVPVFETEESSENFRVAEDPGVERVVPELGKKLEQAGIRVELLPGGKRLVFPRARALGSAIGLTVFFGVWTAIVYGLNASDAPRLFPWLFGLFDVLLLLGVVDMWLYHGFIEARPGELSFGSGLFFTGAPQELISGEVQKLEATRGMQMGNKLYYRLVVHERSGRRHTVAKRLPDLETTERVIENLESILRG